MADRPNWTGNIGPHIHFIRDTMKIASIAVLALLLAPNCVAQATQDYFYGRTDTPAPKIHPQRFAATCRWDNGTPGNAGTVVTCTYTGTLDAFQCYQDANVTNWGIGIGVSHSCLFSTNPANTINVAGCGSPGFTGCSTAGYEAFAIDGTHTAMDWNPAACPTVTTTTQCALHLISVNTSTGAMTLVGPNSQSVAATAGFLRPAYVSVQSNINTPFSSNFTGFVDPLGNWLYPITVNTLCVACSNTHDTSTSLGQTQSQIVISKYGSNCNAAQFETVDMLAAFVNSTGPSSSPSFLGDITGGCGTQFKPLMLFPGVTLSQPDGFDLEDNRFSMTSQPPLVLNALIDRSITIGTVHDYISYLSPYFSNYLTGYWTTAASPGGFTSNEQLYIQPVSGEAQSGDTDFINLVDADQYWPKVEFSIPSADPGWVVAISPLHASFEQHTNANIYTPFHMPDDLNYEKRLSAVAPSGCYMPFSFTSASGGSFGTTFAACSWGDFVRNYFSNSVTAMNTALGSTYTTFGTSETAVASEAVCAAGAGVGQCGNAASLAYTLVHTNPTPSSIHILVTIGGVTADVSGDCWKAVPTCASSASDSSTGTFGGEGSNQGMILNNKAWQASRWIPSGWVLVDGNGNYEVSQGAGETGTVAPTWSTTHGNVADGSVSGGWTEWGPAITHGSTSTITYSGVGAGNLALAFNAVPLATESIAIQYTFGGWGASGTGLLDEDGASANGGSAVLGSNPVALVAPAAWQATTQYGPFTNDCDIAVDTGKSCGVINTTAAGFWAIQVNPSGCTSSSTQPTWAGPTGTEFDEGTCKWIVYTCVSGTSCSFSNAINANATMALLMHTFMYERAYSYINTAWTLHNKLMPSWLYGFPNSYVLTPRKQFLQVANQQGENVAPVQGGDFVLCGSSCGNGISNPMDLYEVAAFQTLFSGTYIVESYVGTTQNEQGDVCSNQAFSNCYVTSTALVDAAKGYYTALNSSLNLQKNFPSLFTSMHMGGRGLGSALHDIQNNSWQLYKSYRDNRTDGVEDTSTPVTCENGAPACNTIAEATGIGTLCSGSPCWVTPWSYNAWGGAN